MRTRVGKFLILFFILTCVGFAQEELKPSSTLSPDSTKLRLDTTKVDSLKAKNDSTKASGGVDTIITYSCADSIIYHFPTRKMSLYKNSTINYQAMELKSERIGVDWNTNIVSAEGVPDSTDTLHGGFRGTPQMKDGGEEYHGVRLTYDFQTKKGKIDVGDTKAGEGYYHGEDIKKVDKDILFVSNGRFTTCDANDPHFYFSSPRMKVITHDQVIAEPVYLYIADVPVFALPFAVFPNKGGRRSGIIAPAYAEDSQRGRLLRHLGYYWAINDYMDWRVLSDLYTRGSFALGTDYRYNLQYYLHGSISGNYKNLHTGEVSDPGNSKDNAYDIEIVHHQDFDPTMSADVNFSFASNNAYQSTIDYNQAIEQALTSNATFSKKWDSPNSMTVNITRYQNLRTGKIDWTLPSVGFNHATSYPFRRKKALDETSNLSWYEMIGFDYRLDAASGLTKDPIQVDKIKINVNGKDTIGSVNEFQKGKSQRIGQNVSINIAPKVGHISITPSLSFNDSRNFSNIDTPKADTSDSALVFVNKKDANRSGILTSSIQFGTTLYGIAQPNMIGIAAFRHTLKPSLTFSYDRQVYGDNPQDKNIYATFHLSNLFEMKTIPEEVGKEGKKINLLTLDLGTVYNFTADSFKLNPLDMSFHSGIGSALDISGGANFDFYRLVQSANGALTRENTLLISAGEGLARLTSFRIGFGTSLSGEKKKTDVKQEPRDTTEQKQSLLARRPNSGMPEPDFSIPWQLQLHWDYSESKAPSASRSSSLNANLDFNLTEKWKFGVHSGYDFVSKEFVFPQVAISRDLHCWVMNFSWTPIGQYRSYQFEIRVKASELQDLKVTKSGSDIGY